MAGYAAQLEQYQKAIDIYEQVGQGSLLCASALPSSPSLHFPVIPCPDPALAWLNVFSTMTPWGVLALSLAQPSP